MTADSTSRRCAACGFETNEWLARCPNCRTAFRTSGQVRAAGGLMVVLGAALSIGMMFLLLTVANAMRPVAAGGTGSFTGTARDATLIVALLSSILVFGVAGTVAGTWQVVSGRRNPVLTVIVLLLGLAIAGLAAYFGLRG